MLTDPSYARYTRNRHWLRQMLPLSRPAFEFLDRIFANHGNHLSLTQLRAEFVAIDTFYMSASELSVADPTARLVASEWEYDTPTEDIRTEDIARQPDDEELFEDIMRTPPADSPQMLSPTSPDSVLSAIETSLARHMLAHPGPIPIEVAEQLLVENFENAESGDIHTVPLSSSPSSESSSSGSDSDEAITPESLPVQTVDVVPDLPSDALGEKLVITTPVKKLNPVKSVVAAGGKLFSKVRFAL